MVEHYTIRALARAAEVPSSTVRYYERAGRLGPEERSGGNYRTYTQRSPERLLFIRAAQANGFTLDDSRSLLDFQDGGRPRPLRQQGAQRAGRSARSRGSLGTWAATGATLSAVLSSACCWLPLLAAAGSLLATGYHFTCFRRPACGPGGACSVPGEKLTRLNKDLLWVATLLVGLFAFFSNYVGALAGGHEAGSFLRTCF